MRASLLASATAATLVGLQAISSASHGLHDGAARAQRPVAFPSCAAGRYHFKLDAVGVFFD